MTINFNDFDFRFLRIILKSTLYGILQGKVHQLFSIISKQATGGVLKNFTKLTGKQLYQSFIFNQVAGLRHSGQRYSGTGVFL